MADGQTSWNLAVRPEMFQFDDIVGDVGEYMDCVIPQSNTFIFATGTDNYTQDRLTDLTVEFFDGLWVEKGRLNPDGYLRLDAGFSYICLIEAQENETLRRLRELVGFTDNHALLQGRIGLGFVNQFLGLAAPATVTCMWRPKPCFHPSTPPGCPTTSAPAMSCSGSTATNPRSSATSSPTRRSPSTRMARRSISPAS